MATTEKPNPRKKTLPKPRVKYYVGEPVVVIPLAEYERTINHMTDLSRVDQLTQNQQMAAWDRHRLLLKEGRANLKSAKCHYKIWSDGYDSKSNA